MSRDRFQRGITLIELLAALTAVAVLVAVLTPALAGARRQSKATVCLQNLARIAQASIIYASLDPDEQAVPVHRIINDTNVGVFRAHAATLTYGGKSGSLRWFLNPLWWGTAFGRGPAHRPMNNVLYKGGFPNFSPPPYGDYQSADVLAKWYADTQLELDVYDCPADVGYVGLHWTDWRDNNLSSYDGFGTSYEANAMWTTNGSRLSANAAFLRPLSQVPNPAETVYYRELCGRFSWVAAPHPDNGCGYGPSYDTILGWHGEPWLFSTAFVDGHAAQVHMRGYESPHLGHYPDRADPDDGYWYFRCVTMRGPGWQMDTLPAPLIQTDIADQFRAASCDGDRPQEARMAPILPDMVE